MGANWALYGPPIHSHFLYVLSGLQGRNTERTDTLPWQVKSLLTGNIIGHKLSGHRSSILVNEAGTARLV
jgi:hypothetical protein